MKIEAIETKVTAKGSAYWVITVGGQKASTFKGELLTGFKLGDEVEIQTEKNASGYFTLKGISHASAATPSPTPEPKPRFDKDGQSIEAQVALKAVVELIVADKITIDQAEETFTKFQKLLAKRVEHGA